MSSPLTLSIPGGAASLPEPAKPVNVEDAARQFESLLIAQMMHSAREASDDADDEQASEKDTMLGVAEQQFAQLMARQGGLGLTRLVVAGLRSPASPPTPAIQQ
jgi:Rod binding domain-containing protein